MFAIRVSYPGGHSVWLTRRFPTVAWGLKKMRCHFPRKQMLLARSRVCGPLDR